MTAILKQITTDPPELYEEIELFIRSCTVKMEKEGVVIGLSGGQDSAVVAMLAV